MGHVSGGAPYKNSFNDFQEQQAGDKSPSNPSSARNSAAAGHWRAVLESVKRCGRYRLPDLPAEVLAAIRQIGGWSLVCGALELDLRPGGPIFQRFRAALAMGAGA